jgi:hypothetical protein
MLLLGIALLSYYFYPTSYHLGVPTQSFGVAVSQSISLDWPITLGLDTQRGEPELDIQALLHPIPQSRSEGPAYVMFVLPFHIDYVISSGVYKSTLNIWDAVNDQNTVAS